MLILAQLSTTRRSSRAKCILIGRSIPNVVAAKCNESGNKKEAGQQSNHTMASRKTAAFVWWNLFPSVLGDDC
jgi:hypothetical protein